MPEPFASFTQPGHPAARRERRHGPDRAGAVPQGDRQGRASARRSSATGGTRRTAPSRSRAFVLDQPEMAGRQILLAGDNFGCGSSREHAPWALVAWGIRAVITTSCADIFRGNALKNGLLPIIVDPERLTQLFELVAARPERRADGRPRVAGRPPAGRRGPPVRRRPVLEADAPQGHRRARLPPRQGRGDRRLGSRRIRRASTRVRPELRDRPGTGRREATSRGHADLPDLARPSRRASRSPCR